MKTIPFFALFAILILSSSYVSSVIDKPAEKTAATTTTGCFTQFRVHRQGSAASLTWAAGGSDIMHFVIERSGDGEYFDIVNDMNNDGSGTYKFNDANPYPGVSYYRITAVKADASTECSSIVSVRIVQRS